MGQSKIDARDDHLQVLIEVVEGIRAEKYADVPRQLILEVLLRHGDSAATDADLARDIERLVDTALQGNTDA